MCLQKSGVTVPAVLVTPVSELDALRLTRNEFERTATPADGSSDVLLLYLALDERLRPRTLYLGMTCGKLQTQVREIELKSHDN